MNFVKGSLKECEFRQRTAERMRISSKDRRKNSNFIKKITKNVNFVTALQRKREFSHRIAINKENAEKKLVI